MHLPTLDELESPNLRRVRKRLRRFARRAPARAARAVESAKSVAESSVRQIRERPLAAALVLFGAGLVAGALVPRSGRR